MAWTFSTGIGKGHEAPPLVEHDTLYLVTPYPNEAYAFDLRNPGGPPKWSYRPKPSAASQGVACCDAVNRGAALWQDLLIYNLLDAETVAVDVTTGQPRWRTRVGVIDRGETTTMAPLVVKDKVLVGNSGGEFGVRGWLTALDAGRGTIAWRAYSTGSDQDCLIGAGFHPFYAADRGVDLGLHTWPPERWKTGGGTVWGFLSYDRDLDLVYYGTANPGVWNPDLRPGDNKWTAGIFARHPESGQAVWAYQWSPHDLYDHDGVNENVLVDLDIGGRRRQVLAHADRNGYFYRPRPEDRGGPVGEAVRVRQLVPRRRPRNRPTHPRRGEEAAAGAPRAGDLPVCSGRQGLAADGVLSPDGMVLHPAQQPVRGSREPPRRAISPGPLTSAPRSAITPARAGNRGAFTAWDPVAKKAGVVNQGELSGLERRPRHRRVVSCSTERWRGGSRRSTRAPASCCGNSRPGRG